MARRNENFRELQGSYLFVEIAKRKEEYLKEHQSAKLISLGIGDTSECITPTILNGLSEKVKLQGSVEGYTGYPDYNGDERLRKLISQRFYNGKITANEIFVSDGSKPDLARLQLLFNKETTITVQDPVYPAYVDGAVISGKAGKFDKATGRYDRIVYANCTPEDDFFPDFSKLPRTDLIFFCSPNNPTGTAATREQLTKLVEFAKKNKSIIIFDAAYSMFISDSSKYPRSIFEIDGADEVAFETSSFSKIAGFTGIRLGWTACPKNLKYFDDAQNAMVAVWNDWARICGTAFNGPSNVAEYGGLACLSDEGWKEMQGLVNHYMENAKRIKKVMTEVAGFEAYGGVHSPYIWLRLPSSSPLSPSAASEGASSTESQSWKLFQELLDHTQIVTTPGVGFGKEGEGFIRISAFARKQNVDEALERLAHYFGSKKLNSNHQASKRAVA